MFNRNNVCYHQRNSIIPMYCREYNSFLIETGFQMGNSYIIPMNVNAPDYTESNYMFDEFVDIQDENRIHTIKLIRNMMNHIFE